MLIAGVVLILTGCFELIRTRHMLKIIIALELAIKAVSMFLVLGGWLNGNRFSGYRLNSDSFGCCIHSDSRQTGNVLIGNVFRNFRFQHRSFSSK